MTEMTSSGGTSLPQTNPRTFGQILERLIELLKTRFRLLVGIAAVPALTLLALYVLLIGAMFLIGAWPHPADKADPEKMLWAVFPAMLLGSLPVMAVYALFEAAGSYAATRADLGVEVTVLEAYRFAGQKVGRYVWLMVLRGLYVTLPVMAGGILVGGGALLFARMPHTGDGTAAAFFLFPLAALLYLGGFTYAVFMMLRLSLVFPACVCEGLTAGEAIQRSARLTRRAKGRIFLVALIVYAMSYLLEVAVLLVAAVLFGVSSLVGYALHLELASALGYLGIGLLAIVLAACFLLWISIVWAAYSTVFAVLYNDQRARIDGPPAAAPMGIGPA